jgi:lactoylglutathione lyase
VAITAGANRGGYGDYFADPDGITLELLQPPTSTA